MSKSTPKKETVLEQPAPSREELLSALVRAERAEADIAELREQIAKEAANNDRRTQQKISMLRLIFLGIALLMAYLGLLVAVNWGMPDVVDKDGVGMAFFQTSKDILLVLTGILGSAMANVFDSRTASRSTDAQAAEPPPQE